MAATPVRPLALPLLLGGCLDWSRATEQLSDGGAPGSADSGPVAAEAGAPRDGGQPLDEEGTESDAALADASDDAAAASDAEVWSGDPDAPVLVLHMDEPSWRAGVSDVRDQSGAQNHGQAIDGANTAAAGRFGRAGSFSSGYVRVPDSASLRVQGALSVSAWFYSADLSAPLWPGIVAKRNGYGDQEAFAIFLDPEHHVQVDVSGSTDRFTSVAVITPSVWHHVAIVFDGTRPEEERVQLYLDGALDTVAAESSSQLPAFTSPLYVGNLPAGGDRFNGPIDEVALWRRALSPSEVTSLYQRAPAP